MLTGISGSKHCRSTSMTSSGFTVASAATWVVTAACSLTASPGVPMKSKISWGVLHRQAGILPGLGAAPEVDHVLDAKRDRQRGLHGRALAHAAYEDRPVAELLRGRVREDGAQHDMRCAGEVALVPLPVLAHIDDLVTVVDQLLDVVDLEVSKRSGLLSHPYLLLLVVPGQSIRANLQDLQREQRALDARRRDVDPQLAEDVVLVDLLRFFEREALQALGQQRG